MMGSPQFDVAHINLAHGFRGGERQTELLIQELAKMGLKQALLCRADSPLREHLDGTPGLTLLPLAGADPRLDGHLKLRARAAIMHAHEALAAQWAYLHSCIFSVPYIITRRVNNPISGGLFNRLMYRRAFRVAGVASVIPQIVRSRFKKVKAVHIHSSCAHMLSDPEKVSALRQRWQGNFVVGHAGALVDKQKGQSTLIKAAALLKGKIPGLKVVFLGSGEDEETLKQQAAELPFVEFEGFQDNPANYFDAFNVFAFPSNYEGAAGVLLDVMEHHVPVVASNAGGIPDIVKPEKSGLLVPPADPQALAAAILRLYQDQELCRQLVEGGVEMAKANSPEAMARHYFDLYQGKDP